MNSSKIEHGTEPIEHCGDYGHVHEWGVHLGGVDELEHIITADEAYHRSCASGAHEMKFPKHIANLITCLLCLSIEC